MKKKVVPYLLLAPMILIMGALVFYPVAATFSYSLKKWKLTQPGDIRVIGFKNYVDILTSDSFWYSLQNTLVILAVVVALTTVVGFLVSSFLNIQVRLSGVLLAQPVEFLTSRWSLLLVVSVVVVWRSVPFMALVCLAGRQSIPVDFYEAARIDGGGSFQIFRRITLPLMLPFVGVGVTSASVTAINVFDEIVALSGYSDLGKNILMESYLTTFTFLDFGKGAAVTYIVLFFALILGIFYLRSLAKEVSYQ